MAAQFDLEVRGHIVVVAQRGSPTFEEANEVVAATVVAALKAGEKLDMPILHLPSPKLGTAAITGEQQSARASRPMPTTSRARSEPSLRRE